ncbi:protein transport protein SEC16B homolog isoform X3 [Lathyrus oleraceus]|uniref:Protein transport protein sec16 n=1 Tax=Pisum sativum TaxID=3888 RepID=A0A9D4XF27_PEA|nr:protein transport protein SEC16B homolog isoform X3 [Pisum sativum]KAI5417526.1 hypothetical protein KIW84_042220 [Pisum sativum]
MASNPPFHVEDQDDEDFFDKLVEDEGGDVKPGRYDEGNHSDGIGDDADANFNGSSFGSSNGGGSGIEVKEEDEEKEGGVKLDGGNVQEGSFLASSSTFGCDGTADHGDRGMESGNSSGSSGDKSTEFPSTDVKVVGWNAFCADSNGGVGSESFSDFFNEFGDVSGKAYHDSNAGVKPPEDQYRSAYHPDSNTLTKPSDGLNASVDYTQYQGGQGYGASVENSTSGEDVNSSQYWESLYPGWKYDHNTGQWYQIDDQNETAITQGSSEVNTAVGWNAASDTKAEVSYMQQAAQSVAGSLAESGTTETAPSWNQVSQGNSGYPEHMVFDPQYPGWYYDTIAQEWLSLATYNASVQSSVQGHKNGHPSTGTFSHNDNNSYTNYGQAGYYGSQGAGNQAANNNWSGSYGIHHQQGLDTHTTGTATKSGNGATYGGDQQFDHSFGSSISGSKDLQNASSSFGSVSLYNKINHDHSLANGTVEPQCFAPSGNFGQHFNHSNTQFDEQKNFSNNYAAESQQPIGYSNQSLHGGQQHSYAPHVGRSSSGRPAHALVTFGFGGKLIIMKDSSLLSSTYGSQSVVQGSVSVLNLLEVVSGSISSSHIGNGAGDYFRALGQQSVPGPLVGGSVGSKELNKWIDERIAHCGSPDMDYKKSERMRLLLSLLKIASQYYGKLRSPFGTDNILKENDSPGSAVAKLFASVKMSSKEYGVPSHCLHNMPSEAQMRATASEVQNLLVSGKKKEALQYAQEGQLWGPALVLASQLGEKFYVDTVKQMALRQLVAGSPLRTLCLLIAGQPAEVFSSDSSNSGDPSAFNMPQHPAQLQFGSNGMLDDWEENLAVITANRTKDDELVIIHLGDCLWKERSEITAAHICYLVAEANFESYSDSARLCLIGADHWKFPRTYASPEAIQRTELYEYSKVLGNSQFVLLPFQPYKLLYAYMLAEVGKVSDSLKYCQAVLKSLKTGRAPEVETWKQMLSSLEERIRTHQQGGYAANLAPGKLVGKLLNFFDSTAHRVVGGLPPPAPSSSQGTVHGNEQNYQHVAHRVSNSQSTMAMSSLVPSDSMEPISEWTADNNRMTKPNRSVSEPDFGRSPRQETSHDEQGKVSGGTSRVSRFSFGSQLLQKTMGLVLKPRPGKQAKLGEKNKFYYDENLKRWVEEGAAPPAEETALPPPPKSAAFQNGLTDYNLKSALKTDGSPSKEGFDLKTSNPEITPGIPPIPHSTNHFSARGRVGVRSRYVDTFNRGGGKSANLFQSPSVPSTKPAVAANAKFFIPAPLPSSKEQTMEAIEENNQEDNFAYENTSTSYRNNWPLSASPTVWQRCPSVGNFANHGAVVNDSNSQTPHSRRTASWGGSTDESFSPTNMCETMPLGEALGMPPSTYMSDDISLRHTPHMRSCSFGEDLHEVDL